MVRAHGRAELSTDVEARGRKVARNHYSSVALLSGRAGSRSQKRSGSDSYPHSPSARSANVVLFFDKFSCAVGYARPTLFDATLDSGIPRRGRDETTIQSKGKSLNHGERSPSRRAERLIRPDAPTASLSSLFAPTMSDAARPARVNLSVRRF